MPQLSTEEVCDLARRAVDKIVRHVRADDLPEFLAPALDDPHDAYLVTVALVRIMFGTGRVPPAVIVDSDEGDLFRLVVRSEMAGEVGGSFEVWHRVVEFHLVYEVLELALVAASQAVIAARAALQ